MARKHVDKKIAPPQPHRRRARLRARKLRPGRVGLPQWEDFVHGIPSTVVPRRPFGPRINPDPRSRRRSGRGGEQGSQDRLRRRDQRPRRRLGHLQRALDADARRLVELDRRREDRRSRPTTSTSSPSTTRRIRSAPSPAWRRWPRKASIMSSGRTSTTAPRRSARWRRRRASSTSPTPSRRSSTPSRPRTRCSAWSRATSRARRSTSI